MSALLNEILAQVKEAMKAKDKERLSLLRTLHSDIKNIGINDGTEITDDVVISVISKTIKQKKDASDQFQKGGREDLVEAEQSAIKVLETFLPEQLSEEELKELIAKVITDTGASSRKDMGKVMGGLKPLINGRADNKVVSQLVQASLA